MPDDTRTDPKDPWYIFFPNMLRRIGRIWTVKSYLKKHKGDPEPTPEPVVETRQFNRMTTRWNGDGMLDWNLVEHLDTLPDSANIPAEIEKWNREHGVNWGEPEDEKVPTARVVNYGDAFFDDVNSEMKTTWDRLRVIIEKRDAEIAKLGHSEPKTEEEYTILHDRFDRLEEMLHLPPTMPGETDVSGVSAMIVDNKRVGGSVANPEAVRLLTATNVISINEARELMGVNKHD